MSAVAWLQRLRVAETAARAQAEGLGWLSDAERQRLDGMRDAARRESFLAGHWQARQLAARWLGHAAERIGLLAHADGRPALALDGAELPLSLSISHSGGWLALALANVPVGVDIELPRRLRDWQSLARFVFSPQEQAQLAACDAVQQAAVFHQLWTLKEARGKRSGEGLQPKQAQRVTALACAVEQAEAASWAFEQGALALATATGVRIEHHDAPDAVQVALQSPVYWRYEALLSMSG